MLPCDAAVKHTQGLVCSLSFVHPAIPCQHSHHSHHHHHHHHSAHTHTHTHTSTRTSTRTLVEWPVMPYRPSAPLVISCCNRNSGTTQAFHDNMHVTAHTATFPSPTPSNKQNTQTHTDTDTHTQTHTHTRTRLLTMR